jgi:predicted transcriptional regulator
VKKCNYSFDELGEKYGVSSRTVRNYYDGDDKKMELYNAMQFYAKYESFDFNSLDKAYQEIKLLKKEKEKILDDISVLKSSMKKVFSLV